MLTRTPGLEQPVIEPGPFEVIIDGEEIIHIKCSTIALEEQGYKPPEEGSSKYTLAFLWWDRFRWNDYMLPLLEGFQLE